MKGKSVGTWLSEKQLRYQPTEDDFLRGKEEHVLHWSVRPKSVSLFLNIIPEQQPQNHALRECDAYRDTTVARIQNRPLRKQLRTALYHYGPKRGRTSSFESLFQHHQLSVLLLDTRTRCGVRPTWHNLSLDFCRFCNYNRSHRISLEHINNLSSKAKDGTAAETFLYPSFEYGSFRPSYRWYWCPFICHSCTVTSLSNSGCPAFLFDGLGTFNADVRFIVLLAYPSDNDCVGAVHSHSKMEWLQIKSD